MLKISDREYYNRHDHCEQLVFIIFRDIEHVEVFPPSESGMLTVRLGQPCTLARLNRLSEVFGTDDISVYDDINAEGWIRIEICGVAFV